MNEIARALPPGSALVSYVHYFRYEAVRADAPNQIERPADRRGPAYLAWVLRSGSEVPEIVQLGDASGIDSSAEHWRRDVTAGASPIPATPGAAPSAGAERESGALLRQAIWDPLLPFLAESAKVFVVPDGSLSLVSLAALPVGEREYLVETGPLLHYLSAERDLVAEYSSSGTGLLAIGGPSYDEASLFARLAPDAGTAAKLSTAPTASLATFRGRRSGCGEFRTQRFEPLPASELEVREVVELWRRARSGADLIDLTGPTATESAFKLRAPGRRVLHLATHGFFLGHCPSAVYTSRGIGKLAIEGAEPEQAEGEGENPLLMAGLVLSGANHRSAAQPDEEDGILTAEEIAALDFSAVEWAVLSACDTGLGEVRSGEGVFGLRRAFRIAGARTLIMSLWSVEDESARAWMRVLYEARLSGRKTTADAVRAASLALLRDRREKGRDTHPFHWGGFVAAGDWR